ncbi:MAG TPA: alpha/beta hydrolase [Ktedonobacteraceae bacterium]|jgi:dienelactone hydrolase|nr:alpha/beta hydrolase [Ktedonobacteraceae bacterium]
MPPLSPATERRMKRWQEQRWILDNIIKTVGIEWDQGRIGYTLGPCGPEATADFMGVRARVQKFNDISREFKRAAVRREAIARRFEEEGRTISARESYFIAALLYGSAQWPIFENSPENVALNQKKIACYQQYTRYADHEVRRVEIPFGDQSLPGYLHFPVARPQGPLPCVLAIDGMDGFKEMMVALYGDKLLERGIAVLAIDGPGQGECTVRDIHVTGTNFMDAGYAVLAWLRAQPEIDPERIAVYGVSFGSLWGTQVAAIDDRLKGCAVAFVCHEPGGNTIFNMASPTFKLRFMYMAGYEDEAEFDAFARTLTPMNVADRIACPYLVVAGEDDDLSPIEYTYELLSAVRAPKELLLYQGEKHGLNTTTSSALGPNCFTYMADWLQDRLNGKPAPSQHTLVDMQGRVNISSWEEYSQAGPSL